MRPPFECPTIVGRSISKLVHEGDHERLVLRHAPRLRWQCALPVPGQVERVHGGHGRKPCDDRIDGLDRRSPAVQHEHGWTRSAHRVARAQAEHSCELGGEKGSGHVLSAHRRRRPTDLRHNGIACGPRTPRLAEPAAYARPFHSALPVGPRTPRFAEPAANARPFHSALPVGPRTPRFAEPAANARPFHSALPVGPRTPRFAEPAANARPFHSALPVGPRSPRLAAARGERSCLLPQHRPCCI